MTFLFITWHFGCLRNYEQTIIRLAERGHRVHLVALSPDTLGGESLVTRLASGSAAISWERRTDEGSVRPSRDLLARIRLMTDYLRYLQPAYQATPMLVDRARRRTPRGVLWWLRCPGARRPAARRVLRSFLRALEEALPTDPDIDTFLRRHHPDVVMFTPLIGLGSEEPDYLETAVRLGLRTVYCVWSWDNLSSKTILRAIPDAVTVWNETQATEAVELHAVPRERVFVTGAQSFDQWFGRVPSRSRVEFCTRVGLPSADPFLLWVCSALFKHSPVEAAFVRRWIQAIRSSDVPALRDVAILIRPHPSRLAEWKTVPLDDLGPVAFWGANPIDPESKNDYYESLHYAAAVVGLNTSAFLEAAIVGRSVFTVLLPEYFDSQEGTLHFPYLLNVAGGLLHAQRSMEGHIAELAQALAAPEQTAERSRRFVEEFIRPAGLDVSATERLVEALECVGRIDRPKALPDTWRSRAVRQPLQHVLRVLGSRWARPAMLSPAEWEEGRDRQARINAHRAEKARLKRQRGVAKADKTRQKEAALAEHRAAKRANRRDDGQA